MGGFDTHSHRWQSWLLSTFLFNSHTHVVDASQSIVSIQPIHHTAEDEHATTAKPSAAVTNNDKTKKVNDDTQHENDVHTYNLNIMQSAIGLSYAVMGRIENSDYIVLGRCGACTLHANRESEVAVMLARHALSHDDRQITVMVVNGDYLPLAYNWICRYTLIHTQRKYIFLAEDRISYRALLALRIPVIMKKFAP